MPLILPLTDVTRQEPPRAPFKLRHIARVPEHDRVDKLAFDVFIELNGLIELCSPVLYCLAPQENRCGFELAEHAPSTHCNKLLLMVVAQDTCYEAFDVFKAQIKSRAYRLLAAGVTLPWANSDARDLFTDMSEDVLSGLIQMEEPPAWVVEPLDRDQDAASDLDEYFGWSE